MTQLFNKTSEKEKRRILRKNSTVAEKIVWTYIRKKQILNERFLRQFSVDYYALDFYCPRLHLAIEIDGDSHFVNQDAIDYDKERQNYIEKLGITFLRFTNKVVNQSNDEVIEIITQKVKKLQKGTLPNPPFLKGRE
ncbi:MAG: endonuclease domain-containing protein [Ignavibacteriota bacterium]